MELPQRDASSANQSGLTLLRIKRKRNEEPLDALGTWLFSRHDIGTRCLYTYTLVVDLPRKKYRDATFGRHPGIFKFLETVDEVRFFQHEANTRELQVSSIVYVFGIFPHPILALESNFFIIFNTGYCGPHKASRTHSQ
jgi:hypothetical protein